MNRAATDPSPASAALTDRPDLTPRRVAAFSLLMRRLPAGWIRTVCRRRSLFLVLAAPGYLAFFGTIFHRNFFVLLAGLGLFAAALAFRAWSEPLFTRTGASDLRPFDPLVARERSHG